MAVLSGNTYIDGDLIVKGNVEVTSLTSQGVKFAQVTNGQDGYLALTTSDGNITKSSIKETTNGTTTTYDFSNVNTISSGGTLNFTSTSVTIDTPVDKITAQPTSSSLIWKYADGTTATYSSSNPSGAKGSNPKVYPISFSL